MPRNSINMLKKKIPIEEARKLKAGGWCWQALAERYGCHRWTVKKYVSPELTMEERNEHIKNHKVHCPLCGKMRGQQKLF